MAGGKLTPRQKMINMMYLVLTALLALNVSKEIMKAPRGREVLSGYAELSVVAFQMWTVRAASFGCGYLDTESEERFFATWGRECAERTMRPPGN